MGDQSLLGKDGEDNDPLMIDISHVTGGMRSDIMELRAM